MKIKIIELLQMINDGKAPQKILYDDVVYEYKEADYQNEDDDTLFGTIFSNYNVNYVLNEYIVILETTIKYNKKIEKLTYENTFENNSDMEVQEVLANKINEIIGEINER